MEAFQLIYSLAILTLIVGLGYGAWTFTRAKKADNDGKRAYFDPETRQ